jgi:hypothetical protein
MTFQRELPVSGIKPHILVMDDTEKDDIPEGAASFRYQTTFPAIVMDDIEKDAIPQGAASFRYQTTYPNHTVRERSLVLYKPFNTLCSGHSTKKTPSNKDPRETHYLPIILGFPMLHHYFLIRFFNA